MVGFAAGSPVVDVKAILYDGSFHDVDSSEMSFKVAGSRMAKNQVRSVRLLMMSLSRRWHLKLLLILLWGR